MLSGDRNERKVSVLQTDIVVLKLKSVRPSKRSLLKKSRHFVRSLSRVCCRGGAKSQEETFGSHSEFVQHRSHNKCFTRFISLCLAGS